MDDREVMRRIDAHLTRANDLFDRNVEALDRHAAAFGRNTEAFERMDAALDRLDEELRLTRLALSEILKRLDPGDSTAPA